MLIIGCDFHTRYQQIAMAREETGELLAEPGAAYAGFCVCGFRVNFMRGLRRAGPDNKC